NKEIEDQYSKDKVEPRDPLDWVSSAQETKESEPEDDQLRALWEPELTGAEMMERNPDLTGADVLEIKMGIRLYETDDDDVIF
ncbi:MAG: hypothetical protein U9R72_17165, partial [Chloroflexota bacterium]|nr:hypothetical protein [Chloroflexota bacterium]